MGLILTTTFALSLWIVLWAIGAKAFDAGMLALVIVLTAQIVRMLVRYLPGNRRA